MPSLSSIRQRTGLIRLSVSGWLSLPGKALKILLGDVASFMDNRRKVSMFVSSSRRLLIAKIQNLGARPSYALLHMDMDIPSEVFLDDSIISLEACVVDMLIIANVFLDGFPFLGDFTHFFPSRIYTRSISSKLKATITTSSP